MKRWFALWLHVAVLALATPVLAQNGRSVDLSTSARRVAVNAPFRVTLSATSDSSDANPSGPTLRPPPGMTVVGGPSVGTQHQMTFSGGQTVVRSGLRATWVLQATRTGRFTVGPATVAFQGHSVRSHSPNLVSCPIN